jgi:hypothetical protein
VVSAVSSDKNNVDCDDSFLAWSWHKVKDMKESSKADANAQQQCAATKVMGILQTHTMEVTIMAKMMRPRMPFKAAWHGMMMDHTLDRHAPRGSVLPMRYMALPIPVVPVVECEIENSNRPRPLPTLETIFDTIRKRKNKYWTS